ncbi:MAG: hypothetical protein MUF48_15285 [Pirellulaceae bacterium]|nr:hypothetical protein [Pirellulaceae bacterium]
MTRRMIAPSSIGCAVALVLSAGCYREPTHPAQRASTRTTEQSAPSGEMPNDSIHAGLATAKSEPGAVIESRDVEIGSMLLVAPDDWIRREPSSQFLITEFSLAKAEGDADDGRLTVSTAGGTVEDNVARWKGQFGDQPETEAQETYRMLGAVIPLDGQLFFIKAYGPAKTVAAHEDRIRQFIRSVKPKTDNQAKESGSAP